MRSGQIFRASDHISNRFLLCRILSTSARKLHRDGVSIAHSINRSLAALDGVAQPSPDGQKPGVSGPAAAADAGPDEREPEPTVETR